MVRTNTQFSTVVHCVILVPQLVYFILRVNEFQSNKKIRPKPETYGTIRKFVKASTELYDLEVPRVKEI